MRKPLTISLHLFVAGMLLAAGAAAQTAATTQQPAAGKAAPDAQTQQAPAATVNIPELPTQKDKVSYSIGMNVGKGLHREAIDIDPKLLMRGLEDAMAGGKTLMTDDQAQATMVELQTQVRQKEEEKRKQEAEVNKKEGDAFLAANKTKPGVVALPSGLQYKVLKAGTGPKPTIDDSVVCEYKGSLLNGKVFDSSEKHGEPATLPLRGIIKAWTEALQLMPVGSKWELYVPSDLAYGERGAGTEIGPNQTLIFEVELKSILPPKPAQAPGAAPGAAPTPEKK